MSGQKQVEIGQVYRDKDKRMLSGRRYLLVVCLGIIPAKVELVPCSYDGTRYDWGGSKDRVVKVSRKNLQTRFELVK